MGDQLSDHYLSAADDLYHLRIPRIWCKMTGTTAPPYTYNAAQWLRDLEDRWKHFEKILSMVKKNSSSIYIKTLLLQSARDDRPELIMTLNYFKTQFEPSKDFYKHETILRVYAVLLVYREINISLLPVLTFSGILLANVILILMRGVGKIGTMYINS